MGNHKYTYTLKGNGNKIVDEFDNTNPDKVNESLGLTGSKSSESNSSNTNPSKSGDLSSVDKDCKGR